MSEVKLPQSEQVYGAIPREQTGLVKATAATGGQIVPDPDQPIINSIYENKFNRFFVGFFIFIIFLLNFDCFLLKDKDPNKQLAKEIFIGVIDFLLLISPLVATPALRRGLRYMRERVHSRNGGQIPQEGNLSQRIINVYENIPSTVSEGDESGSSYGSVRVEVEGKRCQAQDARHETYQALALSPKSSSN